MDLINMLREHFRQAVEGDFPGVLENIRRPDINLAIWRDPLSANAKKYLEGLDVEQLTRGYNIRNKYYFHIADGLPKKRTGLRNAVAELLKNLPTGEGKADLAADICALTRAYYKATHEKRMGYLSLLVFKPTSEGGGFWHADKYGRRGIITLKGDRGTLWAPDDASLTGADKSGVYWGKVDPQKHRFLQEIGPRDFAAFKCLPAPKPLRHATPPLPMTEEYRLALLM